MRIKYILITMLLFIANFLFADFDGNVTEINNSINQIEENIITNIKFDKNNSITEEINQSNYVSKNIPTADKEPIEEDKKTEIDVNLINIKSNKNGSIQEEINQSNYVFKNITTVDKQPIVKDKKSRIDVNSTNNKSKDIKLDKILLWILSVVSLLIFIVLILQVKRKKVIEPIEGVIQMGRILYQNQPFQKEYRWEEAKKYAKSLRLGSFDDWRLPTKKELRALGNIKLYGEYDSSWEKWYKKHRDSALKNSKGEKHFVHEKFLENMPRDSFFWTSEVKDEDDIWRIGFHLGCNDVSYDEDMNYILCVRDIKSGDK